MKATEHLPSGNSAVHKVTSPPKMEACHRCGLTNHKANDCAFKEATCHSCGKRDTSKEPVGVANILKKGKEWSYSQRKREDKVGSQESER